MRNSLLAGLVVFFVSGCSASVKPSPTDESNFSDGNDISQVSSPAEKGPAQGFSTVISGKPSCAYQGGCDGDIHPTSAKVSVDGNACSVDGTAATMHMDPNGPNGVNPGWLLESDAGACGELLVAGAHLDPFPQKGVTAWGNKSRVTLNGDAASDATLTTGPIDHEPHAINGSAQVDGHEITFTFYFGDE